MARHLLIAAATWKYLQPGIDRPVLEQILADVVALFTSNLGCYTRELSEIGANPKAAELTTALDHWFADPSRDADDWVVFYYTGHAEVVGTDALYLLTTDFNGLHASSAFDFRKFADFLLAPDAQGNRRRIRNLLILLDTCFSGQGVVDLSAQLSKSFRNRADNAYYLLAAALPNQEAASGALARALISSIEELSRRSVTQEYFFLDQIVPMVNQELDKKGVQEALRLTIDSTRQTQAFFPNRSFIDTSGKAVPASDAIRAINDQEFRDHWGPRARGVEFDYQPGFYFSGRQSVLDKLSDFLRDDEDMKTRIVTGSPGAGKSAILSHLITLSSPELQTYWSKSHPNLNIPSFDLAVHAKGKTLEDVTQRLADVLKIEPTKDAIVKKLTSSTKPVRIVVDALDEAAEPARITRELLNPLGAAPALKLLVGARSTELGRLQNAEVIDIDQPEYADRDDLAGYVKSRLLAPEQPGQKTTYKGRESLADEVAREVANRAYPNFLIARLVVEDLLSRKEPVDPARDLIKFPQKVGEAFDLYLARFASSEKKIRDLLAPLAYTKGQGLPWDNLWAPLATALAGTGIERPYTDSDIRELLEQAGSFILESTEEGRSVYRLFHQALADTLQANRDATSVAAIYTETLSGSVPNWTKQVSDQKVEGKDWRIASRYIHSYLAAHAAESHALSKLIEQPLYLLTAHPSRLLTAIATSTESLPRDLVGTYREISHHIRQQPISTTAAYLELFARKRNLDEWAARIEQLPVEPAWKVKWARWKSPAPSRSLAEGKGNISALSVGALSDGTEVGLVGRESGTSEIWDITSGDLIGSWRPSDLKNVREIALAHVGQRDVLVAAFRNGPIVTLDLSNERTQIQELDGNSSDSYALALAIINVDGEDACVTAHRDDRLVRWQLPELKPVVVREKCATIFDLHPLKIDDQTLLFGVGDSLGRGDAERNGFRIPKHNASTIYLIDPGNLSIVWGDQSNQRGYIEKATCVRIFDHELGAFYRGGEELEFWDLGERRLLTKAPGKAGRCWFHHHRGQELLLSEWCGQFDLKHLTSRVEPSGKFAVDAEKIARPLQLQGTYFTETIRIFGREVTLSAVGDYVRVWDLQDLVEEALEAETSSSKVQGPPPESVSDLARGPDGHVFVAADRRVYAIDSLNGHTLWQSPLITGNDIERIVESSKRAELYVAEHAGLIHVLDLKRGGQIKDSIRIGAIIETMEVLEVGDQMLTVINTRQGSKCSTRIWDLNKKEELPTEGALMLRFGEEDKPLESLAAIAIGTRVRFAFAGQYGKIMIAEYDLNMRRLEKTRWQKFQEWRVPDAGTEYTRTMHCIAQDGQLYLAAGTENGILAVWDFASGMVLASRADAHLGNVTCVKFSGGYHNRLVSVGEDGAVRIWGSDLEELYNIETGESLSRVEWVGERKIMVGGRIGILTIDLGDE
jgi:WD40 repeat protein